MTSQFQREWIAAVSAPRRALLVDDSLEDCDMITAMSKPFNILWDVAHTGYDALIQLTTCIGCGMKYHLIVLDLDLKSDPQGVELFKSIKKVCPHCPVLILSGMITSDVIHSITQEGFAMFAQKPTAFDSNFFTELFLALNIPKLETQTVIGDI